MINLFAMFGLIAATAAPESPAPASEDESYVGVYIDLFEASNFEPCDNDERWWLDVTGPANSPFRSRLKELRDDYEKLSGEELGNASPPYYLEAKGVISDLGEYGHMGQYDRDFHVSSFGEFRLATTEEMMRCVTSGFFSE